MLAYFSAREAQKDISALRQEVRDALGPLDTEGEKCQFTIERFIKDAESGKVYIGGKTKSGVPVVVNRKKADRITLDEADDYVNFLVLTLDTTIKMMPLGVEKWVWILDLNGYSRANSPPLSVTLRVLKVFTSHYPERMEKCFIVDAPRIFSVLFAAIYPVLDSVTKSKLIFIKSTEYDSSGQRTDGKPDESGFGEYFDIFKTKFDFESFRALF